LLFSEYWPQPATLKLVAEIMTGQRWEWTDKQKLVAEITSERRRGKRPVMTQEERRTRNPIHDAAVEVHILKPRLKLLYPEQSRKAVHERAIKIAATRADIDTEKLTRYLARSRSSPQRIK
jgi:hypothetical protein